MEEQTKKGRFFAIFFAAMVFPCLAEVGVRPASQISNDTIDWMKKVADWQLTQSSWNSSVTWERGALFAGMMACYEATKDEKYLDKSREFAVKFNWRLASDSHHADNNAIGQDYMELYFLDSQDPVRYAHFKSVNDTLVASPTHFYCNVAGGNETWWWCDALFMAPPGMTRLSRALNDPNYINLMHMMWGETQDCLYDTDEHLFFRDITYISQRYNGKKVFWSRGNGWVVAGTARVLQYLPLDDPNRPRYTTLLQEMSGKLKDIQQPDGYWSSDLLSPERTNFSPETSGTGFFTYGIAWGINTGLLDADTYWPTVEAGWEALKAAVQSSGKLGWVQPVGSGPSSSTDADDTDVFGVGAYLLAGSEVLKYVWSQDPNLIEYFESYTSDSALQSAWIDGDTNGTSGQVTLGDYGDNFMQLCYANDQTPYRSQTDYTFATPKDFTLNERGYLSVLVRGATSNTADVMYIRLEDQNSNWAVQVMTDTTVVQTAGWMELAFRLSEFTGIDLTQIKKLSIGVGSPDASSATGSGTIRIDNIRLYPEKCVAVQEDFNGDCIVDMADFAVIASQWLDEYVETITPTDSGTTNLVAYWPLNGDYNDATGNGYDAVAGSSVVFDTGHIGQSAYFNGNNYVSYLNCQNSSEMNLTEGATVSAWIKTTGLSDQYASVVTKGVNAWRLIRNSSSSAISFHFNAAGGGEYQANGSIGVVDGQWHHLVGVYDGSMVYLCVDGQLDAWASAGPVNTSTDPVYIGSRVGRTNDRNWVGWIDDVRIYDTALSYPNILYLAEADPVTYITEPRATDLALDGVINMDDLMIFIESWAQDTLWP